MNNFAEILGDTVTMIPIRGSFIDLARGLRRCIRDESKKPFPDNNTISVLCDSARTINELLVDKEKYHKRIIQDIKKEGG